MPVMDGIEATREMRSYIKAEKLQEPIIVGVTGHTQPQYLEQGRKAGMNEILTKPLYIDVLKTILMKYGILK